MRKGEEKHRRRNINVRESGWEGGLVFGSDLRKLRETRQSTAPGSTTRIFGGNFLCNIARVYSDAKSALLPLLLLSLSLSSCDCGLMAARRSSPYLLDSEVVSYHTRTTS